MTKSRNKKKVVILSKKKMQVGQNRQKNTLPKIFLRVSRSGPATALL